MQMRLHIFLRPIARSLMLLAMVAFVQQSALVAVSQAAAATGLVPQPAVKLSGQVHFHDDVVRQAHAHTGHNTAGHVHGGGNAGNETDEATDAPMWCLSCTSAVVPMAVLCSIPIESAEAIEAAPHGSLIGIEPDGLNRPPSTPNIA